MEKKTWEFTENEKALVASIIAKGRAEEDRSETFAIIDFDRFYALFTAAEGVIMKKWLAIDPKSIGYKLPYLGAADKVKNIVAIPGQHFLIDDRPHPISCQYLPQTTYDAYQELNRALHADLGRKLLVLFGYRSPACQVFLFFHILARTYEFDFDKTIQHVCFPDYSEHCCPQRQAIDFKTQDGVFTEEFDTTEEYAWLQQHAQKFGFIESYPKDNALGMRYEPWHWHHEAAQ